MASASLGLSFRTSAQRGYGAAQGHTAPGNRGLRPVPHQCASVKVGVAGGPRTYLAHPAASGSIAPAEAGAGTGRPREAPPVPQRIPVPPLRPTAPRNLRPASLEFGSARRGRVRLRALKGTAQFPSQAGRAWGGAGVS